MISRKIKEWMQGQRSMAAMQILCLDMNMKSFIFIRRRRRRHRRRCRPGDWTGGVAFRQSERNEFNFAPLSLSKVWRTHLIVTTAPPGKRATTFLYLWRKCCASRHVRALPSHPLTRCVSLAGVDVRRPHGGHPLLQGRSHLQEVRPLQGPWWGQPGQGESRPLHSLFQTSSSLSDECFQQSISSKSLFHSEASVQFVGRVWQRVWKSTILKSLLWCKEIFYSVFKILNWLSLISTSQPPGFKKIEENNSVESFMLYVFSYIFKKYDCFWRSFYLLP